MKILVTGGTGYIGSHTVVELLQADYEVVIVDNLSNSSPVVLDRIEEITGHRPDFVEADIRDAQTMRQLFKAHQPQSVVHFAGLKAVGESVEKPLMYYQNNLAGTATLCEAMAEFGCKKIVFSSSATVYGEPQNLPIREDAPTSATNPYGRTKLYIEEMLKDLCQSDPDWRVALLRYFNPIGAHASGKIGEDPEGIPNNLFPFVTQVAVGQREFVSVFGSDYPTKDGTGVRDYIHVVDLAIGHLRALERLSAKDGLLTCNLGTGEGYSVLDVIKTFIKVSGIDVPYKLVDRRPGDVSAVWADPAYAKDELDWQAERTLEDMCRHGWNWQRLNPGGFKGSS